MAQQPEGLRIVVIEGENSVNIIGQGTAVPTVVEVRDRNDLPVSGEPVVFLLGEGGTATLNAGPSQVNSVCPCVIRLQLLQLTGYTHWPPDEERFGRGPWHGTVSRDANSIDFGFVVLQRQ